jgi:uncharacterized protein (TIGR03382 family)
MSLLIDILIACSGWIFEPILGLFGYDRDWEPIRADTQRKSTLVQAIVCCSVTGILGFGLLWLAWLVSR